MPPEKRARNLEIAKMYNETSATILQIQRHFKLGRTTMCRILYLLELRGDITPRPGRLKGRAARERR